MKNIGILVKAVAALAVLGLCVGGGFWLARQFSGTFCTTRIDEKATLSILHSEALEFLVTKRTATQIVIEHEESNWLGEWNGVLWATVSWRWGVDLKKIKESDISRHGEAVICRLPEPELLDFSVEPESIGFMSKSTLIPKLADMVGNGSQRRELEVRLKEQAMKFARDRNLCPGRQEIVRQLNDAAVAIKNATGLQLQFE